jgi:hypothetical protein
VTAVVPVNFCAQPVLTFKNMRIRFKDEARRALVGFTVTFLRTAFFVVSVGTVPVITHDIESIMPQLGTIRTIHHCASSLPIRAGFQVLSGARCVLA